MADRVKAFTDAEHATCGVHQRRTHGRRSAIHRGQDLSVEWLLALIPVGSLVMAGLLAILLAWSVAMPVVPSSFGSATDTAVDVPTPTVDEVHNDGGPVRFGPAYTR
jgi:hypothetical protein